MNENEEEIKKLKEKMDKKYIKFVIISICIFIFIFIFILFLFSYKTANNSEENSTDESEVTTETGEQSNYQNTISLSIIPYTSTGKNKIPYCVAPVEAFYNADSMEGKIKFRYCTFNQESLNEDLSLKEEYKFLTIKFFNLTQEQFNSLKTLNFTYLEPDNVINQVDGKFYEYHGAWITSPYDNNVNSDSFKTLKF